MTEATKADIQNLGGLLTELTLMVDSDDRAAMKELQGINAQLKDIAARLTTVEAALGVKKKT